MQTHKGYFSLIQYCPDLSRLEAANIGVVLFCPECRFLAAKTSAGNDRIARFFGRGSFDVERLNVAKRAFEDSLRNQIDGLRTLEDMQRFIDTRGNDLVLTSPRSIKVSQPDQDLAKLFTDLVGGRARREEHQPLYPPLHTAFQELSAQGRAVLNVPVIVPILGRTLKIPYSFRNGATNLVKPQVFTNEENPASNAAARLAVEGDLLRRHGQDEGGEKRLIVVPAFERGANQSGLRQRVLDVLREYSVETVMGEAIPQFIERVRQEAH